jgi:hypothetical protein
LYNGRPLFFSMCEGAAVTQLQTVKLDIDAIEAVLEKMPPGQQKAKTFPPHG